MKSWAKEKPQQANMYVIYINGKITVSRIYEEFLETKRKRKSNRTFGKKLKQFFTSEKAQWSITHEKFVESFQQLEKCKLKATIKCQHTFHSGKIKNIG